MRYAKGIMWLDDCRIPYVDDKDMTLPDYANKVQQGKPKHTSGAMSGGINKIQVCNTQGRFTPNLLVCDDMLNDGVISKSTIFDGKLQNIKGGRFGAIDVELTDKRAFGGYSDKGTNSRYYDLDKWFDKIINEL